MLRKSKNLDTRTIGVSFLVLLIAGVLSDQVFILTNYFQQKDLPSSSDPLNVGIAFLMGFLGFLVVGRKVKLKAVLIAMVLFSLFLMLYQIIFSKAMVLPFSGNIPALFLGSLLGYLAAQGKLTV